MNLEKRPEIGMREEMEKVVIVNWHARHAQKRARQLNTWLLKERKDFKVIDSKQPGQITELVQEVLEDTENPLMIIVGGDGSVSQAINGALSEGNKLKNYAFFFVPGGTGNDNSKNLGHNRKREIKGAIFKQPEIKKVDALKMTITSPNGDEKNYFALAHIGFGASAFGAKRINEKRPSIAGQARIVFSSFRFNGINIAFEEELENYADVVFVNGRHFAKVFKADAEIDDGKYDLYFFRRKRLALLAETATAALKPKKGIRKEEFEFTALEELNPSLDGEIVEKIIPGSKIRVSVEKKAVPVVKAKKS